MNTIKVSATSARNRFFELLNQVAQGTQVVIEKDHKEVAILSPRQVKTDLKKLIKDSKEVRRIFKNYNAEDNPLRKKDATLFLGRWDK